MKNFSKILAAGILSQDNISDLLAKAIEANSQLANFLTGDVKEPTVDEAARYVTANHIGKNEKFIGVDGIYFSDDFKYRVGYTYSAMRYYQSEELANKNSYDYKSEQSEDYPIAKEVFRTDYTYMD